jgi:hypothetical protein
VYTQSTVFEEAMKKPMKHTDLADHIHNLRLKRSGRPVGSAMRVMEVWNAAEECELNGISKIYLKLTELPRPFDGLFVRQRHLSTGVSIATVYIDNRLPKHWQEFVAIKEMMHCWSPESTYVGSPAEVKSLVEAMSSKKMRYSQSVAADNNAIIAAAEVILPHYRVEEMVAQGLDYREIAHRQGLHQDVAELICSIEILSLRKNGSL